MSCPDIRYADLCLACAILVYLGSFFTVTDILGVDHENLPAVLPDIYVATGDSIVAGFFLSYDGARADSGTI